MVNSTSFKQEPSWRMGSIPDSGINAQLLADVVHKIKNNLGGIGGFATLLERDIDAEDPRRRLVQRIEDGVEKLNGFVMDLMTLVRMPKINRQSVRFHTLIREVCGAYWGDQEQLFNENVLHFEISDENIELIADPALLRNLVFHAIRFIHLTGGKLTAVETSVLDASTVELRFYFLDGRCPDLVPGGVLEDMNECEPVEARLSLAIVLKMAGIQDGTLSIHPLSEREKVMIIQLLKD
jgi:signal transduction histidine kinase